MRSDLGMVQNQGINLEPVEREMFELNFNTGSWDNINFEDLNNRYKSSEVFVIYFKKIPKIELSSLREMFNLNPILDHEFASSVSITKDQILEFPECILITISDLNIANDMEYPVSLKILYSSRYILLFSEDPLHCLEKLSRNMIIKDLFANLDSNSDVDFDEKPLNKGVFWIDYIFHTILEIIFSRIEQLTLSLNEEADAFTAFSSIERKTDFLYRHMINEQKVIYLKSIIKGKLRIMKILQNNRLIDQNLRVRIHVICKKIEFIKLRLHMADKKLETAEKLYELAAEEAYSMYTIKLNSLGKVFASIATIFLPLMLITAIYGMNIILPFQEHMTFWPFSGLVGICFAILVVILLYFKNFGRI